MIMLFVDSQKLVFCIDNLCVFVSMAVTGQRVSKVSTPVLLTYDFAKVPPFLVWFSPPEGTPCCHPLNQVRNF